MIYPIITLSNISLRFDNKPLFLNVNLSILQGEKVCLVGRNGSGKSSLLKLIFGSLQPDSGKRFLKPGSTMAFLNQDYDFSNFSTLGEFILNGKTELDYLKQQSDFSSFQVDFDKNPSLASGGELRRASIIRTLILPSDVLLLDEPTNHLDINAIEFLEEYLLKTSKAFILISHDRLFLEKVGKKLLWLDRGSVQKINTNFQNFEDFRDKIFSLELQNAQKLKNKIKKESLWAAEGISARRKRNQKRLRELKILKLQKVESISLPPSLKVKFSKSEFSSKLVIEAKNISKKYDEIEIVKDFSLSIHRGERVAIVGANGVGKTTLVNLLLKKENPDFGTVKLGVTLNIALFDQNKDSLPSEMTLWNFLSGTNKLEVTGKNDHIMVQNRPRHILSYLNEFLFTREQVHGRIRELSGGEKSRLLLALLMAKTSNILILDEPTNDLDVETLRALEEAILSFPGCMFIVSHDRWFLDRVATHILAFQNDGNVKWFHGNYSEYHGEFGKDKVKSDSPKKFKPLTR